MLTAGNREPRASTTSPPGARSALTLLLLINLFNYIDRYVLAAVEPAIQKKFFPTNPPNAEAKMGLLATAFIVSYMITAPIFGWLADRGSRWLIIGISVLIWSLATGRAGPLRRICDFADHAPFRWHRRRRVRTRRSNAAFRLFSHRTPRHRALLFLPGHPGRQRPGFCDRRKNRRLLPQLARRFLRRSSFRD